MAKPNRVDTGGHRMRRLGIAGIIFLFTLMILSGCGKKPDVVAKVGKEKIGLEEFKLGLSKEYGTEKLDKISIKDRKKFLQSLIDERLRIIRARELGLDTLPEFVNEISARANNLMAQRMYEELIVDKLVPESLMRTIYDLEQKRIKVVAVVLGYKTSEKIKNERSKEEAIALANEIVERIKKGESAERLSEKYTDANFLKGKKGVIDPYNPGGLDPEVDKAMLQANTGDVVGPVVTDNGIYILKVVTMRNQPSGQSFEEARNDIKRLLYQRYFRGEGDKLYQKYTEEFKKEVGTEIHEDAIQEFVNAVREWASKKPKSDDSFPSEKRKLLLAKVGSLEITGDYFITQFRGRFHRFYQRYTNLEQMKKVLNNHMAYQAWVQVAKKRGYDEVPDIARQIEALKRNKLKELFEQKEIRDKVTYNATEVMDYYEKHKQDYIEPAKIRVWEIAVKDKKLAQKIYQMALNGKDFTELAKQYTEKAIMKKRGGDLGYQTKNSTTLGNLMNKVFEAGPNQILPPMLHGAYYYILKTGDYRPERQKTLQEVRGLVEGYVRRNKIMKRREKITEELRKRYIYWINDYLLRNLS